MNVAIHQGIIGGYDSPDQHLFNPLELLRRACWSSKLFGGLQNCPVGDFGLKLPWLYWVLTVVAVIFAGLGIWEVARWFKGVLVL